MKKELTPFQEGCAIAGLQAIVDRGLSILSVGWGDHYRRAKPMFLFPGGDISMGFWPVLQGGHTVLSTGIWGAVVPDHPERMTLDPARVLSE